MKNILELISREDLNELLLHAQENVMLVTVDGAEINSWADYWNALSSALSFPKLPSYMECDYHSYYDLMTDLSWLEKESIILIIKNADKFLKEDIQLKHEIIKDFKEYLLPFWEEEVLKTVVNGKTKSFCVYLVEENKYE